MKPLFVMLLACASAATATTADAKVRQKPVPYATQGYYVPPPSQIVIVGGSYAGADPDPNIRAALMREFGRRR